MNELVSVVLFSVWFSLCQLGTDHITGLLIFTMVKLTVNVRFYTDSRYLEIKAFIICFRGGSNIDHGYR